jgi:hypothetical protein
MFLKIIKRYSYFILAIALLCVAIFPVIFFYACTLAIEQVLPRKAVLKIERFWDVIGMPYDYLLKKSE